MMGKMTLKEKLEVIRGYAEGKVVEVYDEDSDEGLAKQHDIWDFEYSQYRIKPEATTKFKVGDTLVFIGDVNTRDVNTYEIIEVKQESYRFSDESLRPIEKVEKEFINIKDVLWYFELFDFISKEPHTYPTRITMSDINKELAPYHDALMWKPMYSLGFKLKEN